MKILKMYINHDHLIALRLVFPQSGPSLIEGGGLKETLPQLPATPIKFNTLYSCLLFPHFSIFYIICA